MKMASYTWGIVLIALVPHSLALTASELQKFSVYNPNITYTIEYNKKLQKNITTFISYGWPNYETPEYDDINMSDNITFRVFTEPEKGETFGCLKQGPIGLAFNSVPFLNVYTSTGENAVTAEITSFDPCGGHVSPNGVYHYHGSPTCIDVVTGEAEQFIGVALDGYPIYGPYDVDGNKINPSQLNKCNGQQYTNDEGKESFRYRLTEEFPYTLGCLYGMPVTDMSSQQFCVKPSQCGENPADIKPNNRRKYEDCGGPWPGKPGGARRKRDLGEKERKLLKALMGRNG